MNLREAAQQALEALEYSAECGWESHAITALRAALAEDAMQRLTDVQQEMDCYGDGNVYRGQRSSDSKTPTLTINGMPAVEGPLSKEHRTSQESRQVEPVAYMCSDESMCRLGYSRFSRVSEGPWDIPVYLAPPKREPLTIHQLNGIEMRMRVYSDGDRYDLSLHEFARAIERAHGIGGEE